MADFQQLGSVPDAQQVDRLDSKVQIVPLKFSFTKPKVSAPPPPVPLFPAQKPDTVHDLEYVTEFDGKGRKLGEAATKIIPKLENSWRPEKRMKNIMVESDLSATAEDRFETETLSAGPQPNVQYGLTLAMKKSSEESAGIDANGHEYSTGRQEARPSFLELELQRLKGDIQALPDETSLDAYENVPVEEFGEALLRGMGWEKGKPIGRNCKTVVAPIEHVKRVGREGLGAVPAPKPEKVKRYIKPGETRGAKPVVGKILSIVAGAHTGLRGQVTEVHEGFFMLMVLKSGEKVQARQEELAEIGSLEEEKALEKLKNFRAQSSDTFNGHAADNSHGLIDMVKNRDVNRAKRKQDTSNEGSRRHGHSYVSNGKDVQRSEVPRHQRQSDDRKTNYDDEKYGREGNFSSRKEKDNYKHSGKSKSGKEENRDESRAKRKDYISSEGPERERNSYVSSVSGKDFERSEVSRGRSEDRTAKYDKEGKYRSKMKKDDDVYSSKGNRGEKEPVENRHEGRPNWKDDTREGSRRDTAKDSERSEVSRHERQSDDRIGNHVAERYGSEGKSRSRRKEDDYMYSSGRNKSSKDNRG